MKRILSFCSLSLTGLSFMLLLSGCEVFDPSENNPSVQVMRVPDFSLLGLMRSGETFTGKVSWYSVKTNGGTRTASGERFSDSGDTAAHRSLPFGTLVEVTNLANKRSAILRITDRGPFTHGRVLDVSIGAAKKLDFVGRGVTTCSVQVLRKAGSD